MDFLLPEIEMVVEIKMTRPALSARQLGEQLIVDIAKYKQHFACRTLVCVVYDPEGRIRIRAESRTTSTRIRIEWPYAL